MNFRLVLPVLMLLFAGLTTAQAQAPRVPPQEPGPDGGLVHVVHFGDTLQGIMAAYASYGITLERLQELNGWRFPPQFIYVDEQIIILPPGSIDPGSGLSVPASAAPPVEAAPTADSVTVGGGAAPVEADDPAPVVRLNAEQIAAIPPVETITAFLP